MRFEDLPLNDDILDALYDMRFDNCTPIQEKAIPPILEGHDVIGVAQTGTGKTASFLLPVLQKISEEEWDKNVINCLIMSPTRELAMQIDQQLEGFAYYTDIDSVAVYGGNDGVEFARQKKGLKTGADIVIATPGRLISHMNIGNVDLSKVSVLILDEADRMLDMGFFDDIMKIVAELPKERQTVMFSATMPPKIKKLADNILHNPVNVSIAVSRPADKIKQSSYVCYEREKQGILNNLLKEINSERTLIFASSKLKVKELARTLRSAHKNVGEMHSDLDQDKREDVMLGFKSGRISLLVATDIVARGIDVDDIRTVINYDVPHDAEDYVHRIGRTARAGAEGRAVTFVSEKDREKFMRIEKFLGIEVDKLPVPEGFDGSLEYPAPPRRSSGRRQGTGKGKGGRKPGTSRTTVAKPARQSSDGKETSSAPKKNRYRGRGRRKPQHRDPQKQQQK